MTHTRDCASHWEGGCDCEAPLRERVRALEIELERMKQREGFLEAVCDAWESMLNTAREQMTEAYERAQELKRERDEALRKEKGPA